MLLGLQARLRDSSVDLKTVLTFNFVFNAVGLLMLGASFWGARLRALACFAVVAGAPFADPLFASGGRSWDGYLLAADEYGFVSGLYCFALAALVTLVDAVARPWRIRTVLGSAIAVFVIVLMYLIRQPAAACALLTFFCVVGSQLWLGRRFTWPTVFLALLLMLVPLSPRLMVELRQTLYGVSAPGMIPTHGFSHNLYMGLSAPGYRPFDTGCLDAFPESLVERERPDINRWTTEYYSFLWKKYLTLVATQPFSVIKVYVIKVWATTKFLKIDAIESLLIGASLLFLAVMHPSGPRAAPVGSGLLLTVGFFPMIFAAQAVLGCLDFKYFYPAVFGFVVYRLAWLGVAVEARRWDLCACLGVLILTRLLWWPLPEANFRWLGRFETLYSVSNVLAALGVTAILSAVMWRERLSRRTAPQA